MIRGFIHRGSRSFFVPVTPLPFFDDVVQVVEEVRHRIIRLNQTGFPWLVGHRQLDLLDRVHVGVGDAVVFNRLSGMTTELRDKVVTYSVENPN